MSSDKEEIIENQDANEQETQDIDDFVAIENDVDYDNTQLDVQQSQSSGNTSEDSGNSSGMGSFVDASYDDQSKGDGSSQSMKSELSLVMVTNVQDSEEETSNADEGEEKSSSTTNQDESQIQKKNSSKLDEDQEKDAANIKNIDAPSEVKKTKLAETESTGDDTVEGTDVISNSTNAMEDERKNVTYIETFENKELKKGTEAAASPIETVEKKVATKSAETVAAPSETAQKKVVTKSAETVAVAAPIDPVQKEVATKSAETVTAPTETTQKKAATKIAKTLTTLTETAQKKVAGVVAAATPNEIVKEKVAKKIAVAPENPIETAQKNEAKKSISAAEAPTETAQKEVATASAETVTAPAETTQKKVAKKRVVTLAHLTETAQKKEAEKSAETATVAATTETVEKKVAKKRVVSLATLAENAQKKEAEKIAVVAASPTDTAQKEVATASAETATTPAETTQKKVATKIAKTVVNITETAQKKVAGVVAAATPNEITPKKVAKKSAVTAATPNKTVEKKVAKKSVAKVSTLTENAQKKETEKIVAASAETATTPAETTQKKVATKIAKTVVNITETAQKKVAGVVAAATPNEIAQKKKSAVTAATPNKTVQKKVAKKSVAKVSTLAENAQKKEAEKIAVVAASPTDTAQKEVAATSAETATTPAETTQKKVATKIAKTVVNITETAQKKVAGVVAAATPNEITPKKVAKKSAVAATTSSKSEVETDNVDANISSVSSKDDNIVIKKSATSETQATEVHSNTGGRKSRKLSRKPNKGDQNVSDISLDLEKDSNTLSSPGYIKEKERLRLRKIAAQNVAAAMSVAQVTTNTSATPITGEAQDVKESADQETIPSKSMATVPEVRTVGAASKATAKFDPYAAVEEADTSIVSGKEIEMKSMPVTDKKITPITVVEKIEAKSQDSLVVDMEPAQSTAIETTKSTASNISNASAPTHTFAQLPPMMTESGEFIDVGRLIVVGVLGAAGGLVLSHFAQSTCDFASIQMPVGYYNETLTAHAGMNEFSSLDSVFYGTSYRCIPYDHNYYGQPGPEFARVMSLLALAAGVVATVIVWAFNFTSETTVALWNSARVAACLASIFQFSTLQFYFSPICEVNACGIGAGSFSSVIAGCVYAYMAFEMGRNSPVDRVIPAFCKDSNKGVDEEAPHYSAPELV